MSLSELVSSLGLWVFPVVGLLAFTSVFMLVAIRVSRTSNREMSHCAAIPLGAPEITADLSTPHTPSAATAQDDRNSK